MKSSSTLFCLLAILTCFDFISANAQARLVLNGGNVAIVNGGWLVLQNSAANALTRNSGQIVSEGENNRIKWMMGETTGDYLIPWGYGTTEYLPLSFTKTSGTGNGHFLFSTYRTTWQNSSALPAGVTEVSGGATDNSHFLIDRFWQINAQGYTVKPSLSNAVFGYLDVEHTVANNTIVEGALAAQRWNDVSGTWNDLPATGIADASANNVTVSNISSADLYSWWTLVSASAPLPLNFLTFEAKRINGKAALKWTTGSEIDVEEFDVQKSQNGTSFFTLKKVPAKNNTYNVYEINDELREGKTFYRIKEVGINGSFSYSDIRVLVIKNDERMVVYPNPARSKNLSIDAANVPPGIYQVSIFSLDGKRVFSSIESLQQNVITLKINGQLKKGMYTVTVKSAQTSYVKKIIIE